MLRRGELESFVDGRSRKITVASIHRRINNLIAASSQTGVRSKLVEPAVRARKLLLEKDREAKECKPPKQPPLASSEAAFANAEPTLGDSND
jgi:hypothetical protein